MGDTRRGVKRMLRLFTRYQLWSASDEGATAVEYGIMVALIALAIIVGATAFGGSVNAFFARLGGDVDAVRP